MTDELKIVPGMFYKTLDGRKVRIYAVDGYMDEAIHGAIYDNLDVPILTLRGWNFEGHVTSEYVGHPDNIVSEWKNK